MLSDHSLENETLELLKLPLTMNLLDSHIKAGTPAYMLRDYEMIKHIFAESFFEYPVSNFESANRKEVMGGNS